MVLVENENCKNIIQAEANIQDYKTFLANHRREEGRISATSMFTMLPLLNWPQLAQQIVYGSPVVFVLLDLLIARQFRAEDCAVLLKPPSCSGPRL